MLGLATTATTATSDGGGGHRATWVKQLGRERGGADGAGAGRGGAGRLWRDGWGRWAGRVGRGGETRRTGHRTPPGRVTQVARCRRRSPHSVYRAQHAHTAPPGRPRRQPPCAPVSTRIRPRGNVAIDVGDGERGQPVHARQGVGGGRGIGASPPDTQPQVVGRVELR